jgi:hypothetical protein
MIYSVVIYSVVIVNPNKFQLFYNIFAITNADRMCISSRAPLDTHTLSVLVWMVTRKQWQR